MTMAKVAKYVNANSITEIRPNSCFVVKNQSGCSHRGRCPPPTTDEWFDEGVTYLLNRFIRIKGEDDDEIEWSAGAPTTE